MRAGVAELLLAKHFAVVRTVFNEGDKERGEDDGETAGAEGGSEVRESRQKRGAGRGWT
jgi:hypothetical protein